MLFLVVLVFHLIFIKIVVHPHPHFFAGKQNTNSSHSLTHTFFFFVTTPPIYIYRQLNDVQLQEPVVVVIKVDDKRVEEIIFYNISQMIHLDYKLDQRRY